MERVVKPEDNNASIGCNLTYIHPGHASYSLFHEEIVWFTDKEKDGYLVLVLFSDILLFIIVQTCFPFCFIPKVFYLHLKTVCYMERWNFISSQIDM
jgi:hypothetical protein